MKFIFIGKDCFLYSLIEHNISTDIAIIDLYKNIDDFKCKAILKTVDIIEWSNNF